MLQKTLDNTVAIGSVQYIVELIDKETSLPLHSSPMLKMFNPILFIDKVAYNREHKN